MKQVFVFVVFLAVSYGLLEDEMDKLEKDLQSAHTKDTAKKSLDDLSLDDLIGQLKNELQTLSKDTKDDFYKRFTLITEGKKTKADEDGMWRRTMNLMADDLIKKSVAKDDIDDCMDQRTDCEGLKGYCVSHKMKLAVSCQKTCGYCDKCVNKYSVCTRLAEMGQCKQQPVKMREFCAKACNFCKAPAPPKCSYTKYGCCFDKETTKTDADGKNCPVCQDDYKYVCKTFNSDCNGFGNAGDFMRRHCRETCNICASTGCVDHGDYAFYCPMWKDKLNWCTEKKEIMRHFCPKTCHYC